MATTPDSKEDDGKPCRDFHTVDPAIYGTKAALIDAVECGLPIVCIKCGFRAHNDLQPGQGSAVFGKPPEWFIRLAVNLSEELIIVSRYLRK